MAPESMPRESLAPDDGVTDVCAGGAAVVAGCVAAEVSAVVAAAEVTVLTATVLGDTVFDAPIPETVPEPTAVDPPTMSVMVIVQLSLPLFAVGASRSAANSNRPQTLLPVPTGVVDGSGPASPFESSWALM